jgi:hypothetical protein
MRPTGPNGAGGEPRAEPPNPRTEIVFPARLRRTDVTRVCLVGAEDCDLRFELLSRETAREALATYDLSAPFENTVALDTVSVGAAVSLLNDLNWYLVRFARTAFVREPSVSATEWLSRRLAERLRAGEADPDGDWGPLSVYGVADGRLVDPLFVRRTDAGVPDYDVRDVEETIVVRVTEEEYSS